MRSEISGKIDGKSAQTLIDQTVGKITLEASSEDGSSTFTLKVGETVLNTQKLMLSVDAAYITGKLVIGKQLPDNLATTDDIPDVSDFLTSSDLGKYGTTTIYGGLIETGSIYAGALHLGGALTVYKHEYGSNIGGYLGYDSGFYGLTAGIGIRSANEYSQLVCTDGAARLSYSDDYGVHLTQVVCGQELSLESVSSIQLSVGGDVLAGLTQTAFYPAAAGLTLGTINYGWADVYAAGTSMSDLLARVTALESA